MNEHVMTTEDRQNRHELHHVGEHWWWFLVLGGAMALLGMIAIGSSFAATMFTIVFFGLLLMVAGIAQIVTSFWTGRWSGFMLYLFVGVLYTVVGFFLIDEPAQGAVAMTFVLAAMLIANGAIRLIAALTDRFAGWGWALLSGAVSILLGLMIYKGWPDTGLFIIGLFVGIELLFAGLGWIMFSLGLKQVKDA
ncbi:MAG: HdeD family acid-resistance protein [Pirellulales bacterium]